MSADASTHHPGQSGTRSDLPVATAIEKPARPGGANAGVAIVVKPRVLLVGGAVALIGVAVFTLFLWMVPNAAARELKAACAGLKAEHELYPALCPNGTKCSVPALAPDFTAQDITGKMVKLSDFRDKPGSRGKVVLLNFWASWCGLCKSEKPQLNAMASDMASKDDFVVLALASDRSWA